MIKLKIGDNFLITTNQDKEMPNFVIYTMGCFKAHNKLLIGFDWLNHGDNDRLDYLKAIREEQPRELFILLNTYPKDARGNMGLKTVLRDNIRTFCLSIKQQNPNTKIGIIKIGNKMDTREFKISQNIYNSLVIDKKSILHNLDKLDEYKMFANRYKAIPGELKVINENIKQISKTKKVCDRVITMDDLRYLDLIDDARLEGENLILTIKPLPIYPSEPFGKCISKKSFANNKYLAKATEYLYKGCHFGMVGTRIAIHPNFTPEFIETLDHKFDDMFARSNWSNIGYLHFGRGHLCGGEFNDVIAHTGEHGLEYYFMCLKQYITTANMRDYAGRKVWWYPIYDDDNNLVYCAGLDILRDWVLQKDISPEEKQRIKDMSWDEFLKWKANHGIGFNNFDTRYTSDNIESYNGKEDSYLEFVKETNPELYNILEKGAM